MVQTHVVNTNRKKRSVLSRSKLLLQVLTLRENNKILAKAVAEKAMKICELENEGLSFKNIKLESRESIKSLREYILNLETMVKKAVSELAGLVNRFTSILSSTKMEKQNVEYLSNLITKDYPPSPPDIYDLRGRNVKSQDVHSKGHERKKHRSSINRVHPMNLGKSVCVLEPLKETNDISLENIVSEKNKIMERGQALLSIKYEGIEIKKEITNDDISDKHLQELKLSLSTKFEEAKKSSDVIQSSGLLSVIKREVSNPKNSSKIDSVPALENSVKVIKKPRDIVRVLTSPRKLRPRKSINYAEMLNSRHANSGSHNNHSRTAGDSEDRENKLGKKNTQKNVMSKKNTRKCSTTPLSQQQVKEESIEKLSFIDTQSDFKCLEDLKIKHVQQAISKLHCNRGSTTSKNYPRRSSSNSSNVRKCSDNVNDYNDENMTEIFSKRIIHILNRYDEKKGNSRSDTYRENSDEKDHGRQCSTLPHIGVEDLLSIKQEVISPKK